MFDGGQTWDDQTAMYIRAAGLYKTVSFEAVALLAPSERNY